MKPSDRFRFAIELRRCISGGLVGELNWVRFSVEVRLGLCQWDTKGELPILDGAFRHRQYATCYLCFPQLDSLVVEPDASFGLPLRATRVVHEQLGCASAGRSADVADANATQAGVLEESGFQLLKPRLLNHQFRDTFHTQVVAVLFYWICFIWPPPNSKLAHSALRDRDLFVRIRSVQTICCKDCWRILLGRERPVPTPKGPKRPAFRGFKAHKNGTQLILSWGSP